jgi:hypothetical protein
MTNQQMAELFTGSIVLAVSDYKNIFQTDSRVKEEMMAQLGDVGDNPLASAMLNEFSIEVPVTAISLGITDAHKATDIMTIIGMKKLDENFWAAPGIELVIYTVITPTHMVITNDYLTAQEIAEKGKLSGKLPADYSQKIPLQSCSLYMDFEKSHLPPLLLAPEQPILSEADLAGYVALSGIISSVRYESTPTSSTFHFMTAKGEGNSLMRILQYLQSAK